MNLKKEKIKEIVNDVKFKTGSVVSEAKEKSVGIATEVFGKTSDITNKSKEKIITTIDVNNDGVVDIEDIIVLALKTPGIKIDRNEFLKKELKNKFSREVVELAIATTPLQAGILVDDIDHIAEEIIKYELPYENSLRTLYKVTKTKKTPSIYPRQYSQIKKKDI